MPQDIGRNDLCPCGSGKKLKHCHPNGYGKTSGNRNLIIIGVAVAVVAVGAVAMLRDDPVAQRRTSPVTNAAMPASQGAGTPQPGPAPPGKVWSPEHGHWHDAPAGTGAVTANQGVQVSPGQSIQMPSPQANRGNTPQPPGPAPAGKVWSPEHGHWHDAPVGAGAASANQGIQISPGQSIQMPSPQAPRGNTPQPPGPAPAGKVWSPEHGHWHDAPPGGAAQPAQPPPQPAAQPAPGSGP